MISSELVGTIIETKYRLDEQIGHGGMGAVYRGTQLMVDRTVAIKLLQAQFASHDNFKARFEVEAKAIGRMNHPNCITLFDFGYSQNIEAFYTVVEYINGRSLGSLLSETVSLNTAVSVIRQIASGLDHAHHHGILHRDLKPENIMLASMTDGSEMIKVLDFGIAQIVKGTVGNSQNDSSDMYPEMEDDFEADRITRVGEVFGTPPYMSPEQARSTRNLTPACDLYSLGVIFYELVAGHLPFFSDNPLDILLMHINDPPPPITRLNLLPELHTVIMRLLEKNPKHRIQSGQELISMLDAITQDALERETSKPVHPKPMRSGHPSAGRKNIVNAQPQAVPTSAAPIKPIDAAQRSWVENCESGEIAPLLPEFAQPPQLRRQHQTNPGLPVSPMQVSPIQVSPIQVSPIQAPSVRTLNQNNSLKDRSVGFDTVVSFDDIEAQAAAQRTTRWGVLVLVTALAGLFIFLMYHFEEELLGTTPVDATSHEPAFQTTPTPENSDSIVANENNESEQIVPVAEEPETDRAQNAELPPIQAIPEIIRQPAKQVEEQQFPAATRPATKKREAKEAAKQRKKSPATSYSKPDKINRDDSKNPPSKGPRILEF